MTHSDTVRGHDGLSLGAGAVAGIVATIVYTLYAEAITVATMGAEAFFVPFRQIGAVVLGQEALAPSYDVVTAALAGTIVHFALGAIFGVVLAVLFRLAGLRSMLACIAVGIAFGLAIYALNVFVIFPAAFPWFLENDRIVQSVGHGIFGAVAGWWLARG